MRPLREITGRIVFMRLRRLVGLFTWFYASLHFGAAIFYVVGWSWPELWRAFSEKTYIILGMMAWLLLVPLGVTSNRWSQHRLGKNWRKLHRAIYPSAILVCLHFIWLVRSDYWQPAAYAIALLSLLVWRTPLGYRLRNERSP
jgi:sulfoxide reductase heme-binding subunit YedZ